MQKISGTFFNPTKNLKSLNLAHQALPTTLSESNDLYKTIWKQYYHFLIGTCNCTYNNNDPIDLLNIDTFFALSLTLATLYTKVGKISYFSHTEEQALSSNLGLLHYLNIAVPLTLLLEFASIKLLENVMENKPDETLRIILLIGLHIISAPFLILSIIAQACFVLVELLVAATLVTLPSCLWYPIALAQIAFSDKIYTNQIDEDMFSTEISMSIP